MKQCLFCVACLFLFGCGADPSSFEGSGRTAEQVMADLQQENANDTLSLYEFIAYNTCDCIASVDFKSVSAILNKLGNQDASDMNQAVNQVDALYATLGDKEKQYFDSFRNCAMIEFMVLFARAPGKPLNDSTAIYMETLCPVLFEEFVESTAKLF